MKKNSQDQKCLGNTGLIIFWKVSLLRNFFLERDAFVSFQQDCLFSFSSPTHIHALTDFLWIAYCSHHILLDFIS